MSSSYNLAALLGGGSYSTPAGNYNNAALLGGSYNDAALVGGSYNDAALVGGSYNDAALVGGSYNDAALVGGCCSGCGCGCNGGSTYNSAALLGGGRKLRKGSDTAKAYMAYLRSLQKRRRKRTRGAGASSGMIGSRYLVAPRVKAPSIAQLRRQLNKLQGKTARVQKGAGIFDELKTAAEENPDIVNAVKKGANYWGSWIGENISHNRSIDAQIAELEANIAAYEKLSPEEKKAFKAQHRQAQAALKQAMPHVQQKARSDLSRASDFVKQFAAQKKASSAADDVDDGDDVVEGGAFEPEKDLRDGFMGPYGWIAMGVRKGKERKLEKLREKWWDIRYN